MGEGIMCYKSWTIKTESEGLPTERIVSTFIKILVKHQSYLRTPIARQRTDMEYPPTWADSSVKQSHAMTQSCESPQPRITTAEDAETLHWTTADRYWERENQCLPKAQGICDVETMNFGDELTLNWEHCWVLRKTKQTNKQTTKTIF